MENQQQTPKVGVAPAQGVGTTPISTQTPAPAPEQTPAPALTLTDEQKALMEQLREGSGENNSLGNYAVIPYITIDNKLVMTPTADGREVKARCEPNFSITSKDGDNYITELFAPEFNAVILKFMHRVQRKYVQDHTGNCANKVPFFRSLEFKSFNSDIYVRQDKEFRPPMSYADVKKMAANGDESELWGIAYIMIEGESVARKIELKGVSRGTLFDYMTTKRDYSISGVVTKFSLSIDNTQAIPVNQLVLTNTGVVPANLGGILSAQKELNAMIDGNLTPNKPAQKGEVVENAQVEEKENGEIKLDGVAF